MNYFFLSLLLITQLSNAALKDQIQLNEARYSTSVRPVLQSISNDFYELLNFLRPEIQNLGSIAHYNIKIKVEMNHIGKVCPKDVQKNCQASLANIEFYLHKQEIEFSKLMVKPLCVLETSAYCSSSSHDLQEAYLYNLKAQAKLRHQNFYELKLETDRLRTQTHNLMGQLIPDKDRKEIELVWFDFFKNIEEFFLTQNNPKLFLEWIDKLNFSINEFNMTVEQKEKNYKPGFRPRVEQIHSKWNVMIREFL